MVFHGVGLCGGASDLSGPALMDRAAGEPAANPAAFCPDDRLLRRWMLLGTLCWLGNNLLVGSPVAALMEGLFLVSNLVGYYRHYGFDYWGRGRYSGRRKGRVPPSGRASS
nr:YgjV family protein [Aeromonas veronii]